jgi:hypothetical protein
MYATSAKHAIGIPISIHFGIIYLKHYIAPEQVSALSCISRQFFTVFALLMPIAPTVSAFRLLFRLLWYRPASACQRGFERQTEADRGRPRQTEEVRRGAGNGPNYHPMAMGYRVG